MNKKSVKIRERIIAMLLSVMMVVTMLPTTIFPVMATSESGFFTLTVTNGSNAIKGVEVILSSTTGTWSEDLKATTDANGKVAFATTEIENALNEGTGSIIYTAKIAGYFTKTGTIDIGIDDLVKNTAVQLVKATEDNSFKVTVKEDNESQTLLKDAEVVLESKEGEEWSLNLVATTDENGIAWFDKEGIKNALIGTNNYTLTYKVTLADHIIKTGELTVSKDTEINPIDVSLTKIVSNILNVNIEKGNATVKLNGNVQTSFTVSNEVAGGESVSVEINPTDGYIKTLTINGTNQDLSAISKGAAYTNTINVNENITIDVEIVNEYDVTVNSDAMQGTVTVNDKTGPINVEEGTSISVKVSAKEGYQISSISITGIDDIDITDKNEFTREGIVVNSDISINVTYEKVYTITINYNENGTVSIDRGATEGGSVLVEDGKTVTLIADPNDNYRVSKVIIDGIKDNSISGENYDNDDVYTKELTPTKNSTVVITFAPNRYTVTSTETQNGSIIIENNLVNYDGSCRIRVNPDSGFSISNIQVDGVDYDGAFEEDSNNRNGIILTINNITSDKEISASFVETSTVSMDIKDLFNDEEAIRTYESTFVYDKTYGMTEFYDKYIHFSTNEKGIALFVDETTYLPTYSGEASGINLKSSIIIERIELRHGDVVMWKDSWHKVEGVSKENPLIIIIDDGGIESEITPSEKQSALFYNRDFEVQISATDDYSGIKSIDYFVTNSKIDQLAEEYDNVAEELKTQSGNLYTHYIQNNDNVIKSLTVDSKLNNTDYVSVWFKITDRAGNVRYDRTEYYKVNKTAPELSSVTINGDESENAEDGYYNRAVTATVVIKDRPSSFNKNNNIFSITATDKNGNNIANAYNISWSSNGDIHTATISFNKDANYELTINYVNDANVSMVKAEGVNNVYSFTVDTTAPTGTIKFDEDNTWNKLLNTLTFGIFSNEELTANATISDDISGTYDILYYKSDATSLLSVADLNAIYDEDRTKFTNNKISVSTEEKFVIYARLTDYAGNTSYISTEGAIFDETDSDIIITAEKEPSDYGFYNDDVKLNITVKDKIEGKDVYSGIKTIDYYVVKDGVKSESLNLYRFDIEEPTYNQLKADWAGSIIIDAQRFNSEDVKVVIVVEDNAGNIKNSDPYLLKINTDEIRAKLTMDCEAEKVVNNHGYFDDSNRTATITITEKSSVFNPEAATAGIKIKALDKAGNTIANAYSISQWVSNGNSHSATITFSKNAIYDWSFEYKNKADNTLAAHNFNISGTQTPFSFTLDTIAPTGKVKINDNTWDRLLNVLTFGFYSNVRAEVSAEAEDNISPYVIEYYKTDNVNAMTEAELKLVEFKPYEQFSVYANEKFVVYLKISDYAGNCTYISSAGHVIDSAKSTVTLTQSKTGALYNASDDVKVNVLVEDAEQYSGIKLVEYWILNNGVKTQNGTLFEYDIENPTYDELIKTWSGEITVDKSKNNSNNIQVYVRTVDNADNEKVESTNLAIDTIKPGISVKFDNGNDNNGNTYFNDKRVATVVITERVEQFDRNTATNGIKINAVDSEGKKVDNAYTISDWVTNVNNENPDESTHTAIITFAKDANYTWSISYSDNAGNTNSAVIASVENGTSVAAFDFTVDTVAPTGMLQAVTAEGKKAEWSSLRTSLTFGFVSKGKITVSGTYDDITSESPYKIEYYKVKSTSAENCTTALTAKELDGVKNWTILSSKQQTDDFGKYYSYGDVVVDTDEQFVVYVKLTDLAGNVRYLCTNGLIVDNAAPSEEKLAPEVTMSQQTPANGIYKDDVSVQIEVVDPIIGGTYSGLESITYKVLNMGVESQSGELFAFNIQDPKQSDLVQRWTGKIVVDSKLNNSNNVQVVVYASDMAGNQSSKTITLKIDTTSPVIDIEYNNNNGETLFAGETLFKEDRVATIKVTERNFNAGKVVIDVSNTDGIMPVMSNWTVYKNGTGNGDDTVYMATLTYSADGDYRFDIKYTDEAENECTVINYGNALAPKEFTIDKTLPTVQVSYDNNSAANGKYYKEDRVATVTVTEHNFDESRYILTLTATDNGVATQIPVAGQWTSDGDVHRMTIPFTQDGYYTIDIEFTDKAGNAALDFEAQDFFIDKTNPTLSISGVTNESANNAGEVGLVITATDTNMDVFEPNIYAIIVSDDSYKIEYFNIGKTQDITNGIKYTISNLETDGMYKVTCNVVDKAGNTFSEVLLYKNDGTSYTEQKTAGEELLTFSINRDGSVYEVNEVTEELLVNKYVQSISDDIAIVEVNADELVEYQVILNGKVLTENVDYTVVKEGGNGQWYKYTYLVSKSLFATDGQYELVISSKDKAFNSAFSDVKGRTITFVVDTTEPVVAVSGLETNGRYNVTEQTVTLVPTDDGGLISKVLVGYADKSGNIYENIFMLEGEELINALENGQGKLSFVIKEGLNKDIKIMCWDSSFDSEGNANVYEKIYTGVSVSTNQIAMLWANDNIRNGIIISAVVVILGIVAIVTVRMVRKKKKM